MKLSQAKNNSNSSGLAGFYLLEDSSPLNLYTLSWNQPTILKPLQAVEDGKLLPWHREDDPDDLTPWVHCLGSVVRGAGQTQKITMNCELPEAEADSGLYVETPYQRFYNSMKDAASNDQSLKQLFEGGNGVGAAIPKAKGHALIQCAMYVHNGRDYSPPRRNIAMLLSSSALDALIDLLLAKGPNGEDLNGDLFDKQPHKALHFTKNTLSATFPSGYQLINCSEPANINQNNVMPHYVARLVAMPPNIEVPQEDFNLQSWRPWDSILRYMSAAEQVTVLSNAFNPQYICMAFDNTVYEEFIPAYVRNKSTGVHSNQSEYNPGYTTTQPNNWSSNAPAGVDPTVQNHATTVQQPKHNETPPPPQVQQPAPPPVSTEPVKQAPPAAEADGDEAHVQSTLERLRSFQQEVRNS